jgi:hypothetical protein
VAPALVFDPVLPGMKFETERKPMRMSAAKLSKEFENFGKAGNRPNYETLAFASVRELGELVRTKRVSSQVLTEMYLQRLKKYDPTLKNVPSHKPEKPTRRLQRENTAGRFMDCRGAQRICWRRKDTGRLGARAASRTR